MTEEEKKAIEHLTNGKKIELTSLIRKFKREGIENFITTRPEYINTLLNLISKQQKENDKLKLENEKLKTILDSCYKNFYPKKSIGDIDFSHAFNNHLNVAELQEESEKFINQSKRKMLNIEIYGNGFHEEIMNEDFLKFGMDTIPEYRYRLYDNDFKKLYLDKEITSKEYEESIRIIITYLKQHNGYRNIINLDLLDKEILKKEE